MSKKKTAPKKPWHICDDVIDPVAAKLHDIVRQWNMTSKEPPRPENVERAYQEHGVEFAISWLKLNVSVAFADDFKKHLYGPLSRFKKVHFRALQILDGDMAGTSKTATFRHHAIRTVFDQRYAWLRANLSADELESLDQDEDEILGEFGNRYTEVEHGFRDTVRYLRQTSVILRAKFGKKTVSQVVRTGKPTKVKRGRRSNPNRDKKLANEYNTALEQGECTTQGGFAKSKDITPSAFSKLLTRVREAKNGEKR